MRLLKMKSSRKARLDIDLDDCVAYVVGDIHGCLAELIRLQQMIEADSARFSGRKLLIFLGDYVDRGPNSSGVLSLLTAAPMSGFERICLAGNHEMAMLGYLEGRIGLDSWLAIGGATTLYSYGLDPDHVFRLFGSRQKVDRHIRKSIPAAHVDFLRNLPVMACSQDHIFVHAGLRPGVPVESQTDEDLTTVRDVFLRSPRLDRRWIIHGHTRVASAEAVNGRIAIDTGAFETGRLTALRLVGKKGKFIST